MQIFYTPDIAIKPELPEEEAGHCIRVLRLGEGDEIVLTDGQGSFYKAAISRAHPKHCEVTLLESWKQPDLWNFNLHIAIAPTKNMDRMEWVRGESDGNRDQCDHLFELSFLRA